MSEEDNEPRWVNVEIAAETFNILAMFAVMRRSYEALSDDQKAKVEAAADQYPSDFPKGSFGLHGFDGNHEPHGCTAWELRELSWFEGIKDWMILNSHMPTLITYRRMLHRYGTLRSEHGIEPGQNLTTEQITEVMWAPIVTSRGGTTN